MILTAIIGSLTKTHIPFIANAKTSKDAWNILSNTYGRASRGKIIPLRNKLHNLVNGSRSITDYMLEIQSIVDELALLGVATDLEDIALKVLNGLDESYKEIANAIQACESSILSTSCTRNCLALRRNSPLVSLPRPRIRSQLLSSTLPRRTGRHSSQSRPFVRFLSMCHSSSIPLLHYRVLVVALAPTKASSNFVVNRVTPPSAAPPSAIVRCNAPPMRPLLRLTLHL